LRELRSARKYSGNDSGMRHSVMSATLDLDAAQGIAALGGPAEWSSR
jgi:hypothetical protein